MDLALEEAGIGQSYIQPLAKVSRILGAVEKITAACVKKCYVDVWQSTLK